MTVPFLDTNLFLRHLRQDDPVLSPKASLTFTRIEKGELKVQTSDVVVFESVFTLQRVYKQPKERIAAAVLPLLELPGIVLRGKRHFRKVFDLYLRKNLPFADAYHVVLMERLRTNEIFSFDADFDRIPGIKRRES